MGLASDLKPRSAGNTTTDLCFQTKLFVVVLAVLGLSPGGMDSSISRCVCFSTDLFDFLLFEEQKSKRGSNRSSKNI